MSQPNLPGGGQPTSLQLTGGAAIVAPVGAFPAGVPGNALILVPLSKPSDELTESIKKGPVVVNLSTSSVVEQVARSHAVDVYRSPVGEVHVVDLMLKKGAVIGGEGNGGVIYPELHPGRDAPLGMALILQLLAERELSLSQQVAKYPPFFITKEKVELHGDFSPSSISGLIEELNPDTIDTQDGVKAYFGDGWFHLRISNTEGVVRVIAEASTKEKSLAHQESARRILRASWEKTE